MTYFVLLLLASSWSSDPVDLDKLISEARAKDRDSAYAESAKDWQKVTAAHPYDGQHWLRQADAFRRSNQLEPAIRAYEEAQRLGYGLKGSIPYSLACCHARLGQTDQSISWLQKAMEQGFRRPNLLLDDKDLDKIRADARFVAMVAHLQPAPKERIPGWRHDLKFFYTELTRRHPDLYRRHSKAEFDAFVNKLHDDIANLNDQQIEVRFVRLAAMAGAGHTSLRLSGHRRLMMPIELYQFEEGVAVIAADPVHADLVGSIVLKVGEHPVDHALKTVIPLISYDSPMSFKSVGPMLLARPRVLYGLGLIPNEEEVAYTVRDREGKERKVVLKKSSGEPDTSKWATANKDAKNPLPFYLKQKQKSYWFELLQDEKLVYCQYNQVRNEGSETFEKFCTRMFQFIEEKQVDRLVIDIRWNGGGNSFLNRPLIEGIIRCARVNQRGNLFVIIGRQTFSAAQNCATDLELHTRATFVGEPTGSSPNSLGETNRITLPYSQMTGSMSDLRWWRGWPMDERVWIPPALPAPPTLASVIENVDPALEAIRRKIRAVAVK